MHIYPLGRKKHKTVYFSKSELNALLSAYSFRVANGDWRDYALDHLPNKAVFSIFKHAHEHPLFSIEKHLLKTNSEPQFILYDRKKPLLKTTQFGDLISYLDRLPRLIH